MLGERWYHGTDEESAKDILQNGFNHLHNWFARSVEEAKAVGGEVILSVFFEDEVPAFYYEGDPIWQRCVHEPIEVDRITREG